MPSSEVLSAATGQAGPAPPPLDLAMNALIRGRLMVGDFEADAAGGLIGSESAGAPSVSGSRGCRVVPASGPLVSDAGFSDAGVSGAFTTGLVLAAFAFVLPMGLVGVRLPLAVTTFASMLGEAGGVIKTVIAADSPSGSSGVKVTVSPSASIENWSSLARSTLQSEMLQEANCAPLAHSVTLCSSTWREPGRTTSSETKVPWKPKSPIGRVRGSIICAKSCP